MRLFHVILTALFAVFALVAGIFAAALVAVAGSAFLILKRFRGGASSHPARSAPRSRMRSHGHGDVIDVTATEVAAERIGPPTR
jgi:hypothetical protein